ncbi:hypothetical protein ORIO_22345 (plasmid) [Cereibacter azotoformans]|uniref:hypothetical protein n=1 Tax=Cereibacter azotoformans TaxID=43057 RepID=UPI001EEC7525|nr:hypothetical protein [Cereibacter azotoformans]ULB12518.1 hypothetical protein ORIO_22345 [Cereibacter azotoformans]
MVNKHGLPRDIPDPIKRIIRQRSKFGCVICRAGIFDYEHFDPDYSDATTHDPDAICCLCTACHAKVTRGHFSKAYVRKKYSEVNAANVADVPPPFDSLDFHEGKAELKLGGISYDSGVAAVVKYHGDEIFSISPSHGADTPGINAIFLDDNGKETLRILNNVWQGAIQAWDTEVVGPRIKVRKRKGALSLALRLEPPGRIVIEKLDMRVADAHILVSEQSYALGRYYDDHKLNWFHADMVHIGAPLPGASAIEFLTYFEAEWRDQKWNGRGQRLATADSNMVMQTGLGVANKRMGIIVGANCLKFGMASFSSGGPRPIEKMRQVVFNRPDRVAEYIGRGAL